MSAGGLHHHHHHRDQHHQLFSPTVHSRPQLHSSSRTFPLPRPEHSLPPSHSHTFVGHGMPIHFDQHTMTSQSPQVQTMTQRPAPMSGLDALAAGSQYALQQMQHQNLQTQQKQQSKPATDLESSAADDDEDAQDDARRESTAAQKGGRSNSGSVRRRISRACDQCNQLRTKCDGKQPCAHCVGMFHATLHFLRDTC